MTQLLFLTGHASGQPTEVDLVHGLLPLRLGLRPQPQQLPYDLEGALPDVLAPNDLERPRRSPDVDNDDPYRRAGDYLQNLPCGYPAERNV